MNTKTISTRVITSVLAISLALPAFAQVGSNNPIRNRIQDKIQSEKDNRAAAARAQIEARKPKQSPAQTAQIRQLQTALNFFEFDAGSVDGIMGNQTRTAITEYQAYLDYPTTGQLTEFEAQLLMGTYQRASTDAAAAQKAAENHPDGIRGMLLIARDGGPTKPVGAIPTFEIAGPSFAMQCAKIEAGGAVSGPSSQNPSAAILVPFCDAREAAIGQTETLVSQVAGFTPEQIEQQCIGFAPALTELAATLPSAQPDELLAQTSEFVSRTGQPVEQLTGIATTCLGVGYSIGNPDLTIGSFLLLSALDQPEYAELAGYHLVLGYGTEQDPTLAAPWFQLAAIAHPGATSLFAEGAKERLTQVQSIAAEQGSGTNASSVGSVPSFSVTPQSGD